MAEVRSPVYELRNEGGIGFISKNDVEPYLFHEDQNMQCPNPKCQAILKSFVIEKATAAVGPQSTQYKMAAYCCPYCGTVISTEMDPVAFKADIISKVIEGLKSRTTTTRVKKTTRIYPR